MVQRTNCHSIVIATGLMALVDDCIKERWQAKKPRRISLPLAPKGMDAKSIMHQLFTRRPSENNHNQSSPLRHQTAVAVY